MLENRLEFIRFFLYAMLMMLGLFAYQAWQREHPSVQNIIAQTDESKMDSRVLPSQPTDTLVAETPPPTVKSEASVSTGKIIEITTDTLRVKVDTLGGNIVETKLLQYKKEIDSGEPVSLLTDTKSNRYLAESGLLSEIGPDTVNQPALYESAQTSYQMLPGQNKLSVDLTWQQNGINVTKTFTFKPKSYEINVSYKIVNNSNIPWAGRLYTQLLRTNTPPETSLSGMISTFFGAAISSPQERYQKISFKDMQDKNLSQSIRGGWAAMVQHYFVGAWVPPKNMTFDYYSKVTNQHLYVIGMVGPVLQVPTHSEQQIQSTLYLGPAIATYLEQAAPGLKLTIDYGWFWFIADIIFWMMEEIYKVVGNWGLAIIFVTIIIKILFYYLSAKSYRSMSAMKRLQPKIEKLKEQYSEDKQKLTQATFDLYKQEKVNPMSGCLPILVQIPVFIALYWVLVENVQFRQAPFYFWIHDLSKSDPYYVLPVLMGLSMFLMQRLNPPPPDPMQAKVMMLMPVIFTALFLNFPSGLMIYWIVNNTLSFVQQWYIMKTYQPDKKQVTSK